MTRQPTSSIKLTEPYRIYVKCCDKTLVPSNAIDPRYFALLPDVVMSEPNIQLWKNAKFITNDGKYVKLRFLKGIDNTRENQAADLDAMCQEMYSIPYSAIRSVWYERLSEVSPYWHLIELTPYE